MGTSCPLTRGATTRSDVPVHGGQRLPTLHKICGGRSWRARSEGDAAAVAARRIHRSVGVLKRQRVAQALARWKRRNGLRSAAVKAARLNVD